VTDHPCKLADEILKIVGDTDDSTARVALEIASLLLRHRQIAQAEFLNGISPPPT
jgi:hypothetical protein